MLGIPLLEGTSPASCFPRIAIGYDAVCYSYIWSEVRAIQILRHNASVIFGDPRYSHLSELCRFLLLTSLNQNLKTTCSSSMQDCDSEIR